MPNPGEWIRFVYNIREPRKKEHEGPFKLITHEYDFCDPRTMMLDRDGKLIDYCPRMWMLNHESITSLTTCSMSKEEVIKVIGKESFDLIERKAVDELKRLAQYRYFGRGFDPEHVGQTMTGAEVRARYNIQLLPTIS